MLQQVKEFLPKISAANTELLKRASTEEGRKAVDIENVEDDEPYVEMVAV